MSHRHAIGATLLCLAVLLVTIAQGAGPWMQVRSTHFRVVGEASASTLRDVARRLEEFRNAVFQMLPGRQSEVPTIVVLFADYASFRPFGLSDMHREVPAYFVEGLDAAYVVALLADPGDPYARLRHEYTHAYAATAYANAPAWFNEELAEYFSTCTISEDGTRATVGGLITVYAGILRQHWLPLHSVIGAARDSPLYQNAESAGTFYAESWALVHYLLEDSSRRAQVHQFLTGWDPTTPPQEAFQSAFGCSIDQMESRLRDYVKRSAFASQVTVLPHAIADRTAAVAEQLGDGAVEARLGDLLAHLGRTDEADQRLQSAVRLAPGLADGYMALGQLRLGQNRDVEALEHLRKAAALGADDFDAQMSYGRALLARSAMLSPEQSAEMRAAFERAVTLRPISPEALSGAARAYLFEGKRLDQARALAERAAQIDPSNGDHQLLLARIQAQRGNVSGSLDRLGSLSTSSLPGIAEQARMMAREIDENRARDETTGHPLAGGGESVGIGPSRVVFLRKMNADEQRVFGVLEQIECATPTREMVLVVRSGDRVLRFAMPATGATFKSYRDDVKATLVCGARDPDERVLVTWRPTGAAGENTVPASRLAAVEWVPKNYQPDEGDRKKR